MLASGRVVHRRVENNAVFEDRQVRITDIDADGHNELLVVEARPDQGASLALYMLVDDTLQRVAASSPIGTSNRWLNPVGSGDFDGDGREEIAIVETPHLGALLVVYRWRQNQLVEIVRKSGFSNHRFGDPEQGLSTVIDIDGDGTDEMVIPDARIQELQIIRLVDEQVKVVDRIPLDAVLSGGVLAADLNRDGQPELIYGTADGLLHAVIF